MAFNGFAGIKRDLNRIRLFVIMKITGHSTRGMFLRYDTMDEGGTWKAMEQLEGYLKVLTKPLKMNKGPIRFPN
jgi:hypothetical protein